MLEIVIVPLTEQAYIFPIAGVSPEKLGERYRLAGWCGDGGFLTYMTANTETGHRGRRKPPSTQDLIRESRPAK